MQNRVRVLVVDNDLTSRILTQSLLIKWDYEPILAMGTGDKLIEDAKEKARQKCCGLALIDMRLHDDNNKDDDSGLNLAKHLEGKVRCIILSAYKDDQVLLQIIQKHKNIYYLLKAESPDIIKETIDAEAQKISAAKRKLEFDDRNFIEEISHTALWALIKEYPDQAADVLAKLFPTAGKLEVVKMRSGSPQLSVTSAPRPTSIIFYTQEEQRYEPNIVKIARTPKIQEEVDRYNRFIVGKVTERFTSRLVRSEFVWDIGGASYSYPGDNNVIPFSRFFEEKSAADIEECLKFFFMNVWSRHYSRAYNKANVSLYKIYTEVWGNWYEKCIKAFPIPNPLDISFATRDLQTPEPILWMKTHVVESTHDKSIVANARIAVTHGDLHGDNLLVDSKNNPLVIDFERCGEGHALQDFTELETDIITRLGSHMQSPYEYIKMFLFILRHKELKEFDDLENFQTSDTKRIKKTIQVISTIRSLALKCTGIRDAREYVFGLLFNIIFRATISHHKFQDRGQHQALMLASIACHRLDHWDDPWPPVEWESFLE